MAHHLIVAPFGGAPDSTVAEMRHILAWYARHPQHAASRRGRVHVASLQRRLAEATLPVSTNPNDLPPTSATLL